MRIVQKWMPAALSLALGACAGDATNDVSAEPEVGMQAAALSGEVKPTDHFFSFRQDYRRCMSPFCGGYFVSPVNRSRMRCADGSIASECYVAEIDLPKGVSVENGDLLHGAVIPRTYPVAELSAFVADFALSPVLEAPVDGDHYLAFDTGIRCITTPCPSMGLTALNTHHSWQWPEFSFAGKDGHALEAAFYDELGTDADAGTGAISIGSWHSHFDWRARRWVRTLEVQNVYVTKSAASPSCVVLNGHGDTSFTAWNFASSEEARTFAAGLTGKVEVLDSACADARAICTSDYRPVHGSIDAQGDACVESSNACAFRGAVIEAAGYESKAQGSFSEGVCPSPMKCAVDADCETGFCGWDEANARICKPWAEVGEHCEGYVMPSFRAFCAPGLVCELREPTGDAGGTCTEP